MKAFYLFPDNSVKESGELISIDELVDGTLFFHTNMKVVFYIPNKTDNWVIGTEEQHNRAKTVALLKGL